MALEGSLHDLSLIELLQAFQVGLKTGVLWLIDGAEQGVVYVRAGCLIDAELMRAPARQVIATADDAVLRLLQWQDATFAFQPDSQVSRRPVRIVHDHEWLLREARRRREQLLQQAPKQLLALDTCFALSKPPGGSAGTFRLGLDQWRILSQVAVSPSVHEICVRTGLNSDQALADLAQLLALGL
ncbi:MAG: DUF4388 domain-containing protein, partial [Roseiflexaceae bacterium]